MKATKKSGRKVLALVVTLTMIIGLIPMGGIAASAEENTSSIDRLGFGFNALTGDVNNPQNGIKNESILSGIQTSSTPEDKFESVFISKSTKTEVASEYSEKINQELNANIPIYSVNVGIDEKFSYSVVINTQVITGEKWELFVSRGLKTKKEIVNLGGAVGAASHLSDNFISAIDRIEKETNQTKRTNMIDTLFDTYGTHIIMSYNLGGQLEVSNHVYSYTKSDSEIIGIESSLKISAKVDDIGASTSISGSFNTSNNSTISSVYESGLIRNIGGTYKDPTTLTQDAYENWIDSLESNSVITGFVDNNSLMPIWEAIDNEQIREEIANRYNMLLEGFSSGYLYKSATVADEYGYVSFTDSDECMFVAPGSTLYLNLPGSDSLVSVKESALATVVDAKSGVIKIANGLSDDTKITVNINSKGVVHQTFEFIVKGEGKQGNSILFAGGYGTKERPYLIRNAKQLKLFQGDTVYKNSSFKLLSDIDLGGDTWSPVIDFRGVFDGNGFAIYNFIINSHSNKTSGFFAENYGVVNNLQIGVVNQEFPNDKEHYSAKIELGGAFNGNYFAGIVIGRQVGGEIKNCTVTNCFININMQESDTNDDPWKYIQVGGIVGTLNEGANVSLTTLNESKISVNVVETSGCEKHQSFVGGIAGSVYSSSTLNHCLSYNNAIGSYMASSSWGNMFKQVYGYAYTRVGGLAGCSSGNAEINMCAAYNNNLSSSAHVSGDEPEGHLVTHLGHLVCAVYNTSSYKNCYTDNQVAFGFQENNVDIESCGYTDDFESCGFLRDIQTGELYFIKDKQAAPYNKMINFVVNISDKSIEMQDISIFEYSLNAVDWQKSPVFSGLAPNKDYRVYIRYAATNTMREGHSSAPLYVTTLKHTVDAPAAPTLKAKTHNSITLNSIVGCEYSKDGVFWQESPLFTGFDSYQDYDFYQRYAETETAYASETSPGLTVRTDKSTPETPDAPTTVDNGITDTTVSLKEIDNGEYSKDGVNWQENTEFVGLAPYTQYTFYQRVKAGADSYASATSNGLTVTTKKSKPGAPAMPTLSEKTDTTVTLNTVAGCEYSKDGIIWQESPVFTKLKRNKEYDFYQRYAETDTSYASAASAKATFKTDKFKPDAPAAPTAKRITATSIELHVLPDCDCEYSMDGIHWQNATVFDNLSAATEYSFYQRIKEDANSYPSNASDALTVRTAKGTNSVVPNPPSLLRKTSTTVTLKSVSDAEFKCGNGAWQTSNVFTGLTPNTEYRFYVRYSETETQLASASSTALYVMTDKEAAPAPTVPTLKTITATSVTLNSIYNGEYSLDGLTWQNNPTFTGLSPATNYTFYQRVAETEEYAPSNASAALTVKTDKASSEAPAAPTVLEYTSNSITLNAVNGCEYSIDGINWQRSTYFNELMPHTTYTAYQRIAETDTVYASASSGGTTVTTDKTTVNAPAAPVIVEKTGNSITVEPVAGCEYRIGDGIWQNNNTFDGLSANTEYVIYQRFAETDSCKASDASVGTVVITDKVLTENDPHITVESKRALPGGEITLSVDLSKNAGIAYLKLALNYDSSAFELISATNTGLIGGTYTTSRTTNTKPYIIQWMGAYNSTDDGKILTLTFKAKDDAEIGNYIIGLTVVEAYNEDYEDVAIAVENANIKLQNVIIGDFNGDEVINGKDGILCSQALAGWDVEYSEFAADVNGDGIFNGKDGILLSQYLAGWDVVLG